MMEPACWCRRRRLLLHFGRASLLLITVSGGVLMAPVTPSVAVFSIGLRLVDGDRNTFISDGFTFAFFIFTLFTEDNYITQELIYKKASFNIGVQIN